MYKVIKIILFLITLAPTFSGSPPRQECYSPTAGLPSTHPIATDREMILETSIVIGMTTAQQTPSQPRPHQSNTSLYLTRPNLDYPPIALSSYPVSFFLGFTPTHQIFAWTNFGARPRTPIFLRHNHHDFSMFCWNWTLSPLEISATMAIPVLKFTKNTIVITFAVKTPPPTCKTLNLFNLPHGEFCYLLTLSPSMQRKIASSSASPKEIAIKLLPKSDHLYSTRQFNHDPVELASHRDDRIFRPNQIWV